MNEEFAAVFAELRAILQRHAAGFAVTEDSARSYRLEGGVHPTHRKPFPIAWVTMTKSYVSFHHMGVYARPEVLKGASRELKARMQGKACFNFSNCDAVLFAELEELTTRAFEALRKSGLLS